MVQRTILNISQQLIKRKKSEKEYIYIYICRIFFNHYPFISPWTFRSLHVLAIINSAAINIGVYLSFRIRVFFRSSGIAKISLIPKYVEDGPLLLSS